MNRHLLQISRHLHKGANQDIIVADSTKITYISQEKCYLNPIFFSHANFALRKKMSVKHNMKLEWSLGT